MATVQVPGASLWYADTAAVDAGGPASTVLFIHGMSGTSAVWHHQRTAFPAAGHRVVRLDRRGAGRSVAHEPPTGSNAGDVLALLDALGLDRVHVVGHALGAADAVEVAVHHRDRVASLTVTNGHGAVVDGFPDDLRARLWTATVMGLPAAERELSPTYRALDPEGTTRWEAIAAGAQPADLAAPARTPVHLADLARVSVPSLFVAGDADLLTPAFLIRRLADAVPGSRFAVVERSGHVAHWERPAEWNAIVLAFLAEVDQHP